MDNQQQGTEMRRYTFRGRCKSTGEDVLGGITYVGDSAYIVQGIRTFIEVESKSVVLLYEADTDLLDTNHDKGVI